MVNKIFLVGLTITTIISIVALWPIADIHAQVSTLEQKGPNLNTVILKSHKIKEGDYSDSLIGQVQNNVGNDVNFVEIIATFYDQDGDILGTKNTYTNPYDLKPHMKAPFEMFLDDGLVDQITSYDLMVDWRNADGSSDTQVYEFTNTKASDKQLKDEQLQKLFTNEENENDNEDD